MFTGAVQLASISAQYCLLCCPPCRLSGTGSSGATVRMYIEQYSDDQSRLKEDAQVALKDIIKVRGL
jgi:hypothetical protein